VEGYYQRLGELAPLTSRDGRLYASFEVFPDEGFTNADINGIEGYLDEHGLTYYATGDVYLQETILDYIWRILLFVPPLALLLILAVFRFQMGSARATALSVLPAGIGALWTLGLVGWLGNEVSVVTVLAPIFTIVIGSADGLHFVSHVQDEEGAGKGRTESIVQTLKMVGVPMVITTVTSMAGFLSLMVMNNVAIQGLALFAAAGILLAGVATWYCLPLILTGGVALKGHTREKRSGLTDGLRKMWGLPSVGVLVALLVLAFVGTGLVTTEFNMLSVYKENTAVHKSFEKITEINGGSVPVFLLVDTEGDPLDPAYADRVLALEGKLLESGCVGKAFSVYDLYGALNSAVGGSGQTGYPQTQSEVARIGGYLSAFGEDPAENLVNVEEKVTRVMLFPVDFANATLDEISEMIESFDQDNGDLTARVTGAQYLMRELNESMLANQGRSLLLAFGLVLALLLVSLRSLKAALASLLPILATVFILYGFLGLTGLSLNIISTTIFGITIGVGIDYAVHFTSVWMSFRREGHEAREAAEQAFRYTARPILANALGVAVGLSALLLSPLRIHLYVSEMMWVAMVVGAFLSLSFLPTVLRRLSLTRGAARTPSA